MLADLRQAGHSGTFVFTYNGSGDSGEVDGPYFNGKDIPSDVRGSLDALDYKFDYARSTWDSATNSYVYDNDLKHSLLSFISNLLPPGWEINEGSYGDVLLDINSGNITVKHNQNITTTEYSEEVF